MTDLERARVHLMYCQACLVRDRAARVPNSWRIISENAFLAALSWVWEEQEKDLRTQAERLIALAASVRERVAAR